MKSSQSPFFAFLISLGLLLGVSLNSTFSPASSQIDEEKELPYLSVTGDDIAPFVKDCQPLPSMKEMESTIKLKLEERRKLRPGDDPIDFLIKLTQSKKPITAVDLDGFNLKDINPYDLEVISRLTIHRYSHLPYEKDNYSSNTTNTNGIVKIRRQCLTVTCKKRNTQFDLSDKNKEPACSDALCAAQRIFGKEKGIKILWAYLVYGTSLSPYSDINADPEGLDDDTLNAVIIAMSANPQHLRKKTLKDTGFYRFRKGYTLSSYSKKEKTTVIANSQGAVFDPIDQENTNEKIGIFTHEIGHRVSWTEMPIDSFKHFMNMYYRLESKEWLQASGWEKDITGEYINNQKHGWVSEYAKKSIYEDFGETYTLYRFQPEKLKKISPERYQFMKVSVFNGLEYDQDLCRGQVHDNKTGSGQNQKPVRVVR